MPGEVTAVKERPFIFSADMVKALLAGKKTQTRRTVKPQPPCGMRLEMSDDGGGAMDCPEYIDPALTRGCDYNAEYTCPYGRPGNRLYVKEAWRLNKGWDSNSAGEIFVNVEIKYDADNEVRGGTGLGEWGRYRNPRFMPRKASRITLEITDVRVERVQDITAVEAIDEGAMTLPNRSTYAAECEAATAAGEKKPPLGDGPIERFARKWDDINGPGAWESNPWVWAITFRVLGQ